MFDTPTTLILGAGASVPYGFPIGRNFKGEIINQARSVIKVNEHDPFAIACSQLIFNSQSELNASSEFRTLAHHADFIEALLEDRQSPTIDVFLRDHDQFSEIGRFYSTLTLLKRTYPVSEDGRSLHLSRTVLDSNHPQHETDWYAGLVRAIRNGCGSADELENKNNLSIITFNYDQSLEIYLENFLANTPKHKGASYNKVVDILHMYGRLPRLNLNERKFSPMNLVELAYEKHKDLRIIGERTTVEEAVLAHRVLRNSSRVVFIGFGFDQTNVNLLKLPVIMDRVSVHCHVWSDDPASSRRIKDVLSSWRVNSSFASADRIPDDINRICYETDIANEVEAGLLGIT